MATWPSARMQPCKTLGLNTHPTLHVAKASATTCTKGDLIVLASGLGVVNNDDPSAGTIVGIAAETITAAQAKLQVAVYPAMAGQLYEGTLVGTFAQADLGTSYDIDDSKGYPAIERTTTAVCAVPIALKERSAAVGDVDVRVYFKFIPAALLGLG